MNWRFGSRLRSYREDTQPAVVGGLNQMVDPGRSSFPMPGRNKAANKSLVMVGPEFSSKNRPCPKCPRVLLRRGHILQIAQRGQHWEAGDSFEVSGGLDLFIKNF